VLLVVESDAALGDLYWHIVSTNLRAGDLRYELISTPPGRRRLFNAYWTRSRTERTAKTKLRQLVRPLPSGALRPPSPEEVLRWRNMLE